MKNTLLIIISFFAALTVCTGQADSTIKSNTIFFELGRVGLIYNITFDHRFKMKNYGYKLSVGTNLARYQPIFQAGGGFYFLKGRKKRFLELGTDLSYLNYIELSDDQINLKLHFVEDFIKTFYANLNIGYRFCGDRKSFRIGISPGFMKTGFVPGAYIGWRLKL